MSETEVVILGGKEEIEIGTNKPNYVETWNTPVHEAPLPLLAFSFPDS